MGAAPAWYLPCFFGMRHAATPVLSSTGGGAACSEARVRVRVRGRVGVGVGFGVRARVSPCSARRAAPPAPRRP